VFVSPVVLVDVEKKEKHTFSWLKGNITFKYLGIPLRKNKIDKLNYTHDLFNKVEMLLKRVTNSGLDISHVFRVIKAFLLPKFKYLFHNSLIPLDWIDRMNLKIRSSINGLIWGQPIFK
jgi:hypothetical protein